MTMTLATEQEMAIRDQINAARGAIRIAMKLLIDSEDYEAPQKIRNLSLALEQLREC